MELHNGILYVEWGWLVYLHQVPDECIHSGTRRYRAGKSASWENMPKPTDKRKVLVRYSTIPKATREAYSLPSEQELLAKCQQRQPRLEAARRALEMLEQLGQAVETGWQRLVSGFTHQLSERAAEPYARLQAALDWCLANTPKPYSRQEVLPAFQDLALPVGPAKSYVLFCRKLNDYSQATDKAACLLARRGAPAGNKNRLQMKPVHKSWLIERYADYMKPSLETTWADYKAYSKTYGLEWPELSLATVRQMLDKNRPAWEARRHGLPEATKKVGYVQKKKKPSEPDLLLEFDGTQEPFFYRNELGQKDGRVYSVRVWDMHSNCIVGSAYGVTEDAALVRAAIQDYLLRQRRVPHQFRYDKGAANLSQTVQELLAATGAVKFASQAKRPTARRSEKLLGEFQYQCQRDLRGFRGSNYKSDRNRDMIVHPDRLENEWKTETWESIVEQCQAAERAWNNSLDTTTKEGLTRWERYQKQGLKGRNLSLERLAELLFVERQRSIRYTTHCLELQAPDGERHHFEPQTAPGVVDLDLHELLAGEAPALRVWEMQDASRELVLVKRANGAGGWLEMGKKRAWSEALADMAPGEQREHQALLATDAARKQRMLAQPTTGEAWQLELGPNGQGKASWNDAELAAELAAAEQTRPTAKRPKRPAPAKPTAPESGGSTWFLESLRQAVEPTHDLADVQLLD